MRLGRGRRGDTATLASSIPASLVFPLHRVDAPLASWLRRIQDADETVAGAVLEELLAHLYLPVYRFACGRLRVYDDAEELARDATQETLFRLARAAGECRAESEGAVVQWALVTAQHVLVDMFRAPGSGLAVRDRLVQLTREEIVISFEESIGKGTPTGEDAERLIGAAMTAYAMLPTPAAELLWWRLAAGADWTFIADVFSTTPGGARRRFQRAIGALRRQVLRHLESLPPAGRAGIERWLVDRRAKPRSPELPQDPAACCYGEDLASNPRANDSASQSASEREQRRADGTAA